MANISIKVEGLERLNKGLFGLRKTFNDWSSILEPVGEKLKETYETYGFDSEGSYHGAKWKKLKPATWAKKTTGFMLVESGDMRDSFELDVGSTRATISNFDEKFPWHQLGTGGRSTGRIKDVSLRGGATYHKAGGIPARPMLRINSRIKTEVKADFQDELNKLMNKLF